MLPRVNGSLVFWHLVNAFQFHFTANQCAYDLNLFAEAQRMEQINHANGEATAMLAIADARAKGLNIISRA